jgi:transcriptional regulator with XRE-family HTH domain
MAPETQHLLSVLRSTIRVLGYSYNDVAAKLGVGSGYLSRLFAGKIELKVDHVVSIARAIGFEPEEIIHLAYPAPKNPPSLAAARYQELVSGVAPATWRSASRSAPAAPANEADLDAAVARAFQKLLAPAAAPLLPPDEELEKVVDRMIRKFFANMMAEQKAQGQ